MTKTKTAATLSFHSDGCRQARFAVKVKDYGAHSEAYEGVAESDRERVYTDAQEAFWRDLSTLAEETFGPEYTVYAEGRSGGWAQPGKKIVDGRVTAAVNGFTADDIEDSPTIRRQCIRFNEAVQKMLANVDEYIRAAADSIIEQRKEEADERAKAEKQGRREKHVRKAALILLRDCVFADGKANLLPDSARSHLALAGWGSAEEPLTFEDIDRLADAEGV